jgi:hypothetical protein
LGVAVNWPTGSPFSGSTLMRPSSTMRKRLLNDELKPRALMATVVIPVWMKSTPLASLSAPAKMFPTVCSSCVTPMVVTVAGASVIFSAGATRSPPRR